MMKVVSLVPIKLNSQRLPHKNILPLAGYPLCWHICNTLNKVIGLDEVYVYCSDPNIRQYIPEKTKFLKRPERLDGNLVKGFEIYSEFIKTIDADVYILAHTTSPFIKLSSLQCSLDHILTGEYDSAFSAQRFQTFSWYKGKPINYDLNDVPRTQDLDPIWIETSAFFMFRKEIFTVNHRRIGFNPWIQEVSGIEAIDIDEKKDYDLACLLAKAEEIGV